MPITAPIKTADFAGFINPEVAEPIFEEAAKQSVVQRLVPRTDLGPAGVAIPVVTGRPRVGWVGEAAKKPATESKMGLRTIKPEKAAAIVVVSANVVRANPAKYVDRLYDQLATAFAQAFDMASIHGKATDGTTAGPFSDYLAKTTKAVEIGTATAEKGGVYADFAAALRLLTADRKRLTGWMLDSTVEPDIIEAVDKNGRPIFVDVPTGADDTLIAGRLLRRPCYMGEEVALSGDTTKVVGIGGNFSKAVWGAVGGISYDVSTETAVTINGELVSLWENNLLAIRAEAEYGFLTEHEDASDFVKLTNAA